MIKSITNLRYINLYYVVDTDNKFPDSDITKIKDINVCQNVNERIVESENIIERCCYYNILTDKCENSNYIVLTFDTETTYEYGFVYGIYQDPLESREEKIDFILYNNKKYNATEKLIINAGSEIEIYLNNITSLKDFFSLSDDANLENIISVDFSHLDSSNITDLSGLFMGCSNLLNVDFSNFNSSSLITMQSMFYNCESIESIDLSNFNTSLVIDMSYLFYGCEKLQSIYLSNINTSKVENMAYMFSECKSLVSLDLSYFDTSSLTNMDDMFNNCKALILLDISNFNLDNITDSQNIFKGIKSLRYINLFNVEDKNNIIQNSALKDLSDLVVCQKEEILSTNTNNRKCCYYNILDKMCESDNYIIVYYGKKSEYKNGFINKYRDNISFIINGYYNNILGSNEELIIKEGCKIELYFNSLMTSLESFFDYNHDINAGKIKYIDFSHFNSSLITDMSKAFSGCTSLESINFNNFTFSLVTNTNNMFFGCDSLKSLDLTNFDFSRVTDMSYMFYSVDYLESINTTYLNISSVTKMSYMFYRCISLESIDFSFYPTSPLTNLEKAFYGCKNLTSLNLSKFDTSLVTNMKEVFYGCDNLTYLDISNFNMEKCVYCSDIFSQKDKIIFINIFNLKNGTLISEEFSITKNIIFVCQSENIIINKKAYYCCEFNFEFNECVNMPTTFLTTSLQESTLINPQSTKYPVFTDKTVITDDKLKTTDFIHNDTTLIKESISKTTYIPEEIEGSTDYRNTIFKEPTTFITSETTKVESTFLKEKAESTFNYVKDATNVFETSLKTSKIETTSVPTTNPLIDTTSLNKETTIVTSKSSTESVSTNEIASTDIKTSTSTVNEQESKTTSFMEILTSIIKETKETITKTSNIVPSTQTEKENIPTTSLLEKSTEIPITTSIENKQKTFSLDSTSKEIITERTTSEMQEPEVSTTNLEKVQTTQSNSDTTRLTTSKVDTTQTNTFNVISTGYTTSKVDIEESTTNNENIAESTISESNILETDNSKSDTMDINISNKPTTSEPRIVHTTYESEIESTTSEQKEPESTTSKPEIIEPTTNEPELSKSTSKGEIEITTSKPELLEPTTSEPEKLEPTTSEPEKLEPTTSKAEELKYTTNKPEIESTTLKSENQETTTSAPEIEPSTSESEKQESTALKTEKSEPTTSEIEEPKSTTSKPEIIEPTTNEPELSKSTSKGEIEITTSKPELLEPTTSEPEKLEPTTSEPEKLEPTTSKAEELKYTTNKPEIESTTLKSENQETTTSVPEKLEPTTSEVKKTEYSTLTTSTNYPKTEKIYTTIPNNINLTSIASTTIKIPTTIIENQIKTTITTPNGPATAVLVGISHYITFDSYFTFYVHFVSISGFIFSHTLNMFVHLIYNTLLRILQNQEAICEKINDDLKKASYLCNVVADVSRISSIQIEPEFNFNSQNVTILGISPVAQTLMKNVQNATAEYDSLFQSNIYVLSHSNITTDKRNYTFNITGIIEEQKPTFENIDLILKINTKNEEDIIETDINCTIVNTNVSNYTLNCLGEKKVLYDLQSAVSVIENDLLLVNFDENSTSEIYFSSNSYKFKKKDTNGMSAGIIITIVLILLIALVTVITLIILRKRLFEKKNKSAQDSTVAKLRIP